jgi:hypothetical protein
MTEAQPRIHAPEEAALEVVTPSVSTVVNIGVPQEEPLDFHQRSFSASLWFRPPPAS